MSTRDHKHKAYDSANWIQMVPNGYGEAKTKQAIVEERDRERRRQNDEVTCLRETEKKTDRNGSLLTHTIQFHEREDAEDARDVLCKEVFCATRLPFLWSSTAASPNCRRACETQ